MFDIGWDEMLLTAIIAIVVIGPKELPRALRTAGQWLGKIRRVSGHFRSGIETMIREAELEEMEQKWREQNAAIMAEHPPADMGLVHEAPVAVAPPLESDTDNKPAPSLSKPAPKRKPRKPKAAS